MTRLAIAAAAFLALFAVAANEASALTSSTRQCIGVQRTALRNSLNQARADFRTKYQLCFGPGAVCASACQDEQATCQDPFKKAQAKCNDDDDAQGRDDPSFTSCDDTFTAKIADCGKIVDDQQARDCAAGARLARFACAQGCAAAQAAPIDACNFAFGDCVQACASKR